MAPSEHRLDLLKTLGDNTRYAIYLELARSPRPLSTADIATSLDLHPNTVRPHLERMRDVGLLDARPDASGAVGRPQRLYSLAADAPSLGLEPPVFAMLARMLAAAATNAGVEAEVAAEVARDEGRRMALRPELALSGAIPATTRLMADLGFDPATVTDDDGTVVAFTHCPFQEMARDNPELVCSLHRGLIEGFVEQHGGAQMVEFHDVAAREPCRAQLVAAAPDDVA